MWLEGVDILSCLDFRKDNEMPVRLASGNFTTLDLVQNFEQAEFRYQLAIVIAQYIELLRHSLLRFCEMIKKRGVHGLLEP